MKQVYLAGMAAAVGLLVSAAPAKAVTLTATPSNVLASGSYSVTVNQVGAQTFSVTVTGNNDGRTAPTGPLAPAKHSVGRISFGFLRADGTFIDVNEGATSGGSTSGGGFVGSPYTVTPGTTVARFNAPTKLNDVAQFGGNLFQGTVVLSSVDQANFVTVALQNGTQQWSTFGNLSVVPEPASMALVLPGLAPMALALLRNRRRRKACPPDGGGSDEDETVS